MTISLIHSLCYSERGEDEITTRPDPTPFRKLTFYLIQIGPVILERNNMTGLFVDCYSERGNEDMAKIIPWCTVKPVYSNHQ